MFRPETDFGFYCKTVACAQKVKPVLQATVQSKYLGKANSGGRDSISKLADEICAPILADISYFKS